MSAEEFLLLAFLVVWVGLFALMAFIADWIGRWPDD